MIPLAFIGIMLITFTVMAIVMAPTSGQKALERRMGGIRATSPLVGGTPEISRLLKEDVTTKFQWLEEILKKYPIISALELRILQADSKTTPTNLLLYSLGMAVGGALISYMLLPVLAIQAVVALVLGYGPFGYLSFKRSRRIGKFNAGLPDAIDMMSRALRAGHSMTASISIVAEQSVEPVRSEFAEVFKQQNFGLPLRDALMQLLDHVPSQDLRVLVTGMLVQKETGGNLAEILDRTVFVIRERLRIQGEIRTHTAQGRMTGYILCMLPVVMLGIINMINPGYSQVLFYTPLGHKLLYAGIGLLSLGGLIIRQIVNGIEV